MKLRLRKIFHIVATVVRPLATMLGLGKKARAAGEIIEKIDEQLPQEQPPKAPGG